MTFHFYSAEQTIDLGCVSCRMAKLAAEKSLATISDFDFWLNCGVSCNYAELINTLGLNSFLAYLLALLYSVIT